MIFKSKLFNYVFKIPKNGPDKCCGDKESDKKDVKSGIKEMNELWRKWKSEDILSIINL